MFVCEEYWVLRIRWSPSDGRATKWACPSSRRTIRQREYSECMYSKCYCQCFRSIVYHRFAVVRWKIKSCLRLVRNFFFCLCFLHFFSLSFFVVAVFLWILFYFQFFRSSSTLSYSARSAARLLSQCDVAFLFRASFHFFRNGQCIFFLSFCSFLLLWFLSFVVDLSHLPIRDMCMCELVYKDTTRRTPKRSWKMKRNTTPQQQQQRRRQPHLQLRNAWVWVCLLKIIAIYYTQKKNRKKGQKCVWCVSVHLKYVFNSNIIIIGQQNGVDHII